MLQQRMGRLLIPGEGGHGTVEESGGEDRHAIGEEGFGEEGRGRSAEGHLGCKIEGPDHVWLNNEAKL